MAEMMNLGLQQALQAFLGGGNDGCVFQPDEGQYRNGGPVAILTGSSSGPLIARLRSGGFTSIKEFALLPSARTNRWIIPIGDSLCTLSGLNMYTPYVPGARALKQLLLAITRMGWTGWARHKVVVASRRPLTLESFVREVTGEPSPEFALSLGTPGRFRKLTIQVMRPAGEVLGYVKLPMTHEAVARIRREAVALEYLSRFSALQLQIPRVLYAGEWGEGYMLFQTAGPSRPAPVEFGVPHQEFLNKLRSIGGIEKPGEALVEEIGARWRKTEGNLDSEWRALGTAALMTACRELRKQNIQCGITHGDFAPWNTRIFEGFLFVFDWEYAELQSPYYWDIFHFDAQVSSLLHRKKRRQFPLDRGSGERALYLLYLLDSVCLTLDEKRPGNQIPLTYRRRLLTEELSA
jgi:hypothetical protein